MKLKKYLLATVGLSILLGQQYGWSITYNVCGDSGYINAIYLVNHTNIPIIGHNTDGSVAGPTVQPGEKHVLSCNDSGVYMADKPLYRLKNSNKGTLAAVQVDTSNEHAIKNHAGKVPSPTQNQTLNYPKGSDYRVSASYNENITDIYIYIYPYPSSYNVNITNYSIYQFSVNGNHKGSIKPANGSDPTYTGITPKIQSKQYHGNQYIGTVTISKSENNKAVITNSIYLEEEYNDKISSKWQIPTEEIMIYNSFSDIMIGASQGSGTNFDISLISIDDHRHPTTLQFNAVNNLTHYNDFWLTQTNPIKNIQSTSLDQKHTDGVIYPGLFCNLYAPTCTLSWEVTGAVDAKGNPGPSGTQVATINASIDTSQAKPQANFKSSQYKPINAKDITYPQNSDGSRKYPYAIAIDVDDNNSNMDISLNPYPNNFNIYIKNKTEQDINFKIYAGTNQEDASIVTNSVIYYPSAVPLAQKQNNGVTYQDTYIIENTATGHTTEIPVTIHQDEPGDLSSWSITNQLPKTIKLGQYVINPTVDNTPPTHLIININDDNN